MTKYGYHFWHDLFASERSVLIYLSHLGGGTRKVIYNYTPINPFYILIFYLFTCGIRFLTRYIIYRLFSTNIVYPTWEEGTGNIQQTYNKKNNLSIHPTTCYIIIPCIYGRKEPSTLQTWMNEWMGCLFVDISHNIWTSPMSIIVRHNNVFRCNVTIFHAIIARS